MCVRGTDESSASSSETSTTAVEAALHQVVQLWSQSEEKDDDDDVTRTNLYTSTGKLRPHVDTLLAANDAASTSNVLARDDLDGVWEVVYMPHIVALSAPLGITFRPVRYTLTGRHEDDDDAASVYAIDSEVRIGIAGRWLGWLGAAGTLHAVEEDTSAVRIAFTRFWVRRDKENAMDAENSALGAALSLLGRIFFIETLAVFPVRYLTTALPEANDMSMRGFCVFDFPPLRSSIGAVRIAP